MKILIVHKIVVSMSHFVYQHAKDLGRNTADRTSEDKSPFQAPPPGFEHACTLTSRVQATCSYYDADNTCAQPLNKADGGCVGS